MITANEKLDNLYNAVCEWAKDKGINKQLPKDGLAKVGEESGEVIDAVLNNSKAEIEDAIGDLMVTLINFGNEINASIKDDIEKGIHHGNVILTLKKNDPKSKAIEGTVHRVLSENAEEIHTQAFQVLTISSTIQKISSLLIRKTAKQEHLTDIENYLEEIVASCTILANEYGLKPLDCLEEAYNVIKGRTGKMVDGSFVKTADLKNGIDNQ